MPEKFDFNLEYFTITPAYSEDIAIHDVLVSFEDMHSN